MKLCIEATAVTDAGRVRTRNEDAYGVEPELGIAVVADGMGGAPAGDIASRVAVDTAAACLRGAMVNGRCPASNVTIETGPPALAECVEASVRSANERVYAMGQGDPGWKGMGCTLTALMLCRESGTFGIGHVGDSRAYRFRAGRLECLTEDHTVAQQSVAEGRIPPQAARDHPFGHVLTRVVGTGHSVEPMVVVGQAEPGDVFLLCTDGVMRVMDEDEVSAVLTSYGEDLEAAGEALVAAVNARGGPDNATLVMFQLVAEPTLSERSV